MSRKDWNYQMSNSLKIFSVVFVILASLAMIIDDEPTEQDNIQDELSLSFSEFDEIVLSPIEKISAVDLANYLIKQQHHYNLYDLRKGPTSYQIPTSEQLSIQQVLDKKIAINETIVLYSNNETRALQLHYLLKIRGYFKVKVLSGGVQQWHQEILQPNISRISNEKLAARKELTEYFGGNFSQSKQSIEIKQISIEKKIKEHHGC